MRLVLITSKGCVTKEATAPAKPVDNSLRTVLSSTSVNDLDILIIKSYLKNAMVASTTVFLSKY
jgi:hypothetical protein